MTFWKDWESWERIIFILVCGMVVVIIVGSVVAWVNRWKTKLYNKAFAEEVRRCENVWHRKSGHNDVPFGVRALESGVQVDGVYSPKLYATPRNNITQQGASASPVSSIQPSPLTPTVSRSSQPHRSPFSPLPQ